MLAALEAGHLFGSDVVLGAGAGEARQHGHERKPALDAEFVGPARGSPGSSTLRYRDSYAAKGAKEIVEPFLAHPALADVRVALRRAHSGLRRTGIRQCGQDGKDRAWDLLSN